MKGSDKQIKWAQDIINKALEAFDIMIRNYDNLDSYGDAKIAIDTLGYSKEAVEAARKDLEKSFEQVDQASMIIEARHKLTFDAIRNSVKNVYMKH